MILIIFADDDNRVSLKPIGNSQHEYINACYMNVRLHVIIM